MSVDLKRAERTPWFDAKQHNPIRPDWYEFRTLWGSLAGR